MTFSHSQKGGRSPALTNKLAIVTGVGPGMGKVIAELFALKGANVILADINMEGFEAVAAAIQVQGGKAVALMVNVAQERDMA